MPEHSTILHELCQFSVMHSRAQQLNETFLQLALREITRTAPDDAESWTTVWMRLADQAAASGNTLEAVKLYNLARFPFVDGPKRRLAHQRCIENFQLWAQPRGIVRWDFSDPGFAAYATGLDRNRPVVIVTGGIVSIKEQWHKLLSAASLLGRCIVVTEMAGVGENQDQYGPMTPSAYGRILDRLAGRADISQVHLLAFSFSGHLALRTALEDCRIRRITTVGAPAHHYFTDPQWHRQLPLLTRTTLAHLLGVPMEALFAHMREWALTPNEVRALDIPVDYLASTRDEVIPASENDFLRAHLDRLNLLLVDDVHASPDHARLTALWVMTCLLRGGAARAPLKAWFTGMLLGKQIRQAGARMVTA